LAWAVTLGVCGLLAASAAADGPPTSIGGVQLPTLSSAISTGTSTVNAGQPVTVAVTVTDQNVLGSTGGIEEIDGVDPAAFDVKSAQSDAGACTTGDGAIRCPLGTMNPGNQVGNTIVLLAKTPGTFKLSARSSGGGGGSQPVTLTLTVVATTADASVKVPAVTLAPKVGGKARVGVLILNGGPLAENSTSLSLTLPPQVKLLAATAQGGTCDVKRGSCKLGGVASGAQELIVLTFQGVKPGKGQVVIRGAGDVADPTAINNQGTIAINVPKPVKR
jgi:hypothetical protein